MTKWNTLLAAAAILAAVTVPVAAQDGGDIPPEVMKAMQPGEHHKHLQMLVGDYTISGKAWMEPGGEPSTFTGTRSGKMILGGRYLEETIDSEMMGMPFHGMGIMGYDNVSERYTSTWYDNMSTSVLVAYGSCSPDGVWTLEGEHVDPMTGEMSAYKNVIRKTDAGIVFEWWEKENKMMEITYSKKK